MRTSIHQMISELHSFFLEVLDPTQKYIWRVCLPLELCALNHSNSHASYMDLVEADFSFSRERHHENTLLVDVRQFETYQSIGLFMA